MKQVTKEEFEEFLSGFKGWDCVFHYGDDSIACIDYLGNYHIQGCSTDES